jgi:hypothetical protein
MKFLLLGAGAWKGLPSRAVQAAMAGTEFRLAHMALDLACLHSLQDARFLYSTLATL